jgi:chromosome segregation ATPase
MMELSQVRLFIFNATSRPLAPPVEDFLRSSGAISIDLETSKISPEAIPTLISELLEKGKTNTRLVEMLRAENARLQSELDKSAKPVQADEKLKQSYERLQQDIQALKAQNADALTSIKVLEDENEELMAELEKLSSHRGSALPR